MKKTPDLKKFMALNSHCRRIPVAAEEIRLGLDPALLYKGLFAGQPDSFLFESGKGPESIARYSIMGVSNSRSIRIDKEKAGYSDNGGAEASGLDPLSAIESLNFEETAADIDYLPHFWGGWVGFLGYEAARWLENFQWKKKSGAEIPDLYFMQVDRLVVYDHKLKILKYIVSKEASGNPEKDYGEITHEIDSFWKKIRLVLKEIHNEPAPSMAKSRPAEKNGASLRSNLTKGQYMDMVKKTMKYIEEGDIYQANLAQRFETECEDDPFDLYLRLRKINPSPFAGFLNFRDFAIISSSPERLVKLENNVIETRPIAGTRPRGQNPHEDALLASELLLNDKEKAEHLMLVDLERNDLGRICRYGSVEVTDLMFLEKYSHVSHIVSNIRGIIKPDVSVLDILKAAFPGGTITGCPKIRCMEIIDELETACRGPYSGSFGYIGFARQMDFNIIIRTIIIKDKKACFHVGAGIVADSIPEREYQETLDKAAAMIKVLTTASE